MRTTVRFNFELTEAFLLVYITGSYYCGARILMRITDFSHDADLNRNFGS